jgi:hypothetical protein
MPRAKQLFKELDVARAVRAVARTGTPVGRVIVDPAGNIVVEVAETNPRRKKKAEPRRKASDPRQGDIEDAIAAKAAEAVS